MLCYYFRESCEKRKSCKLADMHCGNPFDLRGGASRNFQEQAMLFEMSCKKLNPDIDRSITLEKYTEIWLQTIAPDKLAKSTLVREKQDTMPHGQAAGRILPTPRRTAASAVTASYT